MSNVEEVFKFLDRRGIDYKVSRAEVARQADIARTLVSTCLLSDGVTFKLAIYPATGGVNIESVREQLGPDWHFATAALAANTISDWNISQLPPFGIFFSIETIVDQSVASWKDIAFSFEENESVMQFSTAQLIDLVISPKIFSFASGVVTDSKQPQADKDKAVYDLLSGIGAKVPGKCLLNNDIVITRINETNALPPMQRCGKALLDLFLDTENQGAKALTEIVETDPALAAKLVSMSRSAFYGYKGSVNTVFEAINNVLGYQEALNVSIGIYFSRQLKGPMEGRTGIHSNWTAALKVARFLQTIAINKKQLALAPPKTYLVGLLHNIGYAALAHLYPREFSLFNRIASASADVRLTELEANFLGVHPNQLGKHILSSWQLPMEVCVAAEQYTDSTYNGAYAKYSHGVLIARHICLSPADNKPSVSEAEALLAKYALTVGELDELMDQTNSDRGAEFVHSLIG